MKYITGIKSDGTYRDYISYSSWSLWKKNKEEYRRRYYENIKGYENKEMLFGKEIGEMLEANHESLKHIPRYPEPEFEISMEIKPGVKVLAYLDSYDPDNHSIIEYKSSHLGKNGEVPWDKLKVYKHKQLDWYSLLVKLKTGKVNKRVKLVWLETGWIDEYIEFDGHKLFKGRKLILTGKVEIFERIIFEYERKRIMKDIIKTVKEIDHDFRTRFAGVLLQSGEKESQKEPEN